MTQELFIDLGLPSGTLWKTHNEEGFYLPDEANETFGDRMPTKAQWQELINECVWEWNGSGHKVTGKNGNSIELPADGFSYLRVIRTPISKAILAREWNTSSKGVLGHYRSCSSSGEQAFYDFFSSDSRVGIDFYTPLLKVSVRLVKYRTDENPR